MRYGVVVLAGGTSRRFGAGEKTDADLAGRSVLAQLLAGLPAAADVVLVGPERRLPWAHRWIREQPVGGGPAAAAAAGCAALDAEEIIVLLAGDQPFAGRAVPRLVAGLVAGVEAAVGLDPAGGRQPLLAAYRRGPLLAALGPDAAGRSMRSVLAALHTVEVSVDAVEALDVDTPADLAAARRVLERAADTPPR